MGHAASGRDGTVGMPVSRASCTSIISRKSASDRGGKNPDSGYSFPKET